MPKLRLTKEQREEIINSTKSNKELGIIYGVSHKTISYTRIKAGKGIGSKSGGNFKLTKDQIAEILEAKIKPSELALKFGVTRHHVSLIRSKAGISRPISPKGFKKGKPKKEPKPKVIKEKVIKEKVIRVKSERPVKVIPEIQEYQMKIILNPFLTLEEAFKKTGITRRRVSKIRKDKGVKFKKELPIKIISRKKEDKVKLQASMSNAEQNYLVRKKAKEISKSNPQIEADKISSGNFKWVTRKNKFGKTERALVRIDKI